MNKEPPSKSVPESGGGGALREVGRFSKEVECPPLLAEVGRPLTSVLDGGEVEAGDKMDEPPENWLEPLEEDDDNDDDEKDNGQSWELGLLAGAVPQNGGWKADLDSLAGESEQSGSLAGSERIFARKGSSTSGARHRKRKLAVEDWKEFPQLGKGWKRKEVFRRSGFSVGKTDTYYMSPGGDRIRSKIELIRYMSGIADLSAFDFKSGLFMDGMTKRAQKHRCQKIGQSPSTGRRKSSKLSVPPERSKTPASVSSPLRAVPLSLPPNGGPCLSAQSPGTWESDSLLAPLSSPPTPSDDGDDEPHGRDGPGSVPPSQCSPGSVSTSPEPGLYADGQKNAPAGCARCRGPFAGPEGSLPPTGMCVRCRSEKKHGSRRTIFFRKWLPCGQCHACLVTEDCGKCASCRNGLLNPESRKPIRCRRRKCLFPVKKSSEDPVMNDHHRASAGEWAVSENQKLDFESEDFSLFDDDDLEGGARRRSRRSCGTCSACLHNADCGTCDFCIDKPKFGGSNKKRQKCRKRQCQKQAMRHLLPFQMDKSEFMTTEGRVGLAKPRPHDKNLEHPPSPRKSMALWEEPRGTDDQAKEDGGAASGPVSCGLEMRDGDVTTSQLPPQTKGSEKSGRSEMRKEDGLSDRLDDGGSAPLPPKTRVTPECTAPPFLGATSTRPTVGWDGNPPTRLDEGAGIPGAADQPGVLEVMPKITQIFSLADRTRPVGADPTEYRELRRLLAELRMSVLPTHWVALMTEGPRLQLVQCSKLSPMADTVLLVEPGLTYQLSVQGQPLLPTHPVYDSHPARLRSATDVVALLQALEDLAVCQGFPLPVPPSRVWAALRERAAACDFLVPRTAERCGKCSVVAPLMP